MISIGIAAVWVLTALTALQPASSQVVTSPNSFFVATTTPNANSGITQGGGVSYQNIDGTLRVINSSDGVPVALRASQVAMSSLLINAIDGRVQVNASGSPVSTYVTPYSNFLSTGGIFNQTGSVNGSLLSAIPPFGNTSFQLNPSERYVLVLGNSSGASNATYRIQTTGTKTLPSGQVVTATLVPGNLAVLGNFQSTGSAILDLQVQQQRGNTNGLVDFFLVDQQQAIQLQSSDYVARITASPTSGTATPTATTGSGGSTTSAPLPPSVIFFGPTPSATTTGGVPVPPTSPATPSGGAGQPPPVPSGGTGQPLPSTTPAPATPSGPSGPGAGQPPPSFSPVPTGGSGIGGPGSPGGGGSPGGSGGAGQQPPPSPVPTPSPPNAPAPSSPLDPSSSGPATQGAFLTSNTPALVAQNSAVQVTAGTRTSVRVNMQDYVGQLYLLAYYVPTAENGGTPGSGIRYTLQSGNDPEVLVTAAFRLSSTVADTPPPAPPQLTTPTPGVPATPAATSASTVPAATVAGATPGATPAATPASTTPAATPARTTPATTSTPTPTPTVTSTPTPTPTPTATTARPPPPPTSTPTVTARPPPPPTSTPTPPPPPPPTPTPTPPPPPPPPTITPPPPPPPPPLCDGIVCPTYRPYCCVSTQTCEYSSTCPSSPPPPPPTNSSGT